MNEPLTINCEVKWVQNCWFTHLDWTDYLCVYHNLCTSSQASRTRTAFEMVTEAKRQRRRFPNEFLYYVPLSGVVLVLTNVPTSMTAWKIKTFFNNIPAIIWTLVWVSERMCVCVCVCVCVGAWVGGWSGLWLTLLTQLLLLVSLSPCKYTAMTQHHSVQTALPITNQLKL